METSSGHLLHILSEPPTSVDDKNVHKWQVGDIFTSQLLSNNPYCVLLDIDDEGHTLALKISDEVPPVENGKQSAYIALGPNGLNVSEIEFGLANSHYIHSDKVLFAATAMNGGDYEKCDMPLCRLSPASMNALKKALAQRWESDKDTWFRYLMRNPLRPVADESETEMEVAHTSTNSSHPEMTQMVKFDRLLKSGFQVERFLDNARDALDGADHHLIKLFAGTATGTNSGVDTLGRHSDPKNLQSPLKETWDTLVACAEKLKLQGNPTAQLASISELARFFGYQPGDAVIHQPGPSLIHLLPTEIWLAIVSLFDQTFDRLSLFNLGCTTKLFNNIVNVYLYRCVTLSGTEKWDKFVRGLPTYGHHTREIYLEAVDQGHGSFNRLTYQQLRAIGDFCPLLERLYLHYPLRLGLNGTEADLPPKIELEVPVPEEVEDDTEMTIDDQQEGQAEDEQTVQDDSISPVQSPVFASSTAAPLSLEDKLQEEKRSAAELDHIIKNCPNLQNFSIQWTGSKALRRYYQKIPKLKAIRLWDQSLRDQDLISLGKHCRNLERFYFDGQDTEYVTEAGLIGLLNAIHKRQNSRLKRIGVYHPRIFRGDLPHAAMGDDEEFVDDEETDVNMVDEDNEQNAPHVMQIDIHQTPLYKFIDVLSIKHPYLERLALIGCATSDSIVRVLGQLSNLQSLDVSRPSDQGLSAVGIAELVRLFKGKILTSLNLSGHGSLTRDDIELLTGNEGLKSLRFVRFAMCRDLADLYLHSEWIHQDDLVTDGTTFKARDSVGISSLWIGEGWKEGWDD